MRVGRTGLRMSSGGVRHFRSEAARAAFERVAEAVRHGWHPTGAGKHNDSKAKGRGSRA